MTARRARSASWLAVGLGLGLGAAAVGCGKKGPPLAPLRPVPARIEAPTVRRLGDTVRIELTVPATNTDGSSPAELERIEVYGLTIDPAGAVPDPGEFIDHGMLVARLDIRPPLPPPGEGGPPAPPETSEPHDPRPAQGDRVVIEETLTEEARTPVLIGVAPARPAPGPRTLAALAPEPGPERTYLAIAIGRRERRSPPSARQTVPLGPMPLPPDPFEVSHTETALVIAWGARDPDPWQPIWPLLAYRRGVDVYEVTGEGVVQPKPLNPAPVTGATFEVPLAAFGEARCFAARTTESVGARTWSGAMTGPVCVTPVDTFPPAAPTGLVAVSSGGVISLIWDRNVEPDLGGYVVLRAEAPGETLRPVTEPIRDATYRDADVRPGIRYVYAVVAVDTAAPPNVSAPSARAEEVVR